MGVIMLATVYIRRGSRQSSVHSVNITINMKYIYTIYPQSAKPRWCVKEPLYIPPYKVYLRESVGYIQVAYK